MMDGALGNVAWESIAFKAGIVPGMQLLAVNGEVYSADKLRDAIRNAEKGTEPITLLLKDRDTIKSVALDYHGGLRVPHLERVAGTPARLDEVLAPIP
jgi:predicted metalloprotease with PDZ domain